MVCEEFIEGHTEYRDGVLPTGEIARFDAHMDDCASCRGYDSVLERGLAMWRALPPVETSPDFRPRLQHRLFHVEDAAKLPFRAHVGRAAAIVVASAALFSLGVSNRTQPVRIDLGLPPVTVEPPAPAVAESQRSLFNDGPYIPDRFLVPFAPALDDAGGLFSSSYDMTIVAGDSTPLPAERRSGQLDESR
ncbi:anti-sigma factor family protein [Candidatus Palauibacter sp.]|uniref:anti-sigma factor family protein n=1 Tax=Candidatus Palauibacter sp. TaxID=3101350 RepID=UPI003CC5A96D